MPVTKKRESVAWVETGSHPGKKISSMNSLGKFTKMAITCKHSLTPTAYKV